MRILTVSHSCVVGAYQDRVGEIAKFPEIKMTLLVPQVWKQFNQQIALEIKDAENYNIIARQPYTFGVREHVKRNVIHVYPGIGKLLKWLRPHIVELWEEPYFAVTWHILRLAKKMNPSVKTIFFSAQNIYKDYPWPFGYFERYVLRNADYVFPCNEEALSILRNKGYQGGAEIVPLGVDTGRFQKGREEDLRKQLGLTMPVVGFIGKMVHEKGVQTLIEASAKVKAPHNLLLIGNGDLKEKAVDLARKLGIEKRTVFIPAVPAPQVPAYFRCCDIVVMPSLTMPNWKEQFGRVLVEAMASNVPVIGSDSGEIPNVIGDSGLVFPEKNSDILAERIDYLLNNESIRVEYAEKGFRRAIEKFTWSSIARQQRRVYYELLGKELP